MGEQPAARRRADGHAQAADGGPQAEWPGWAPFQQLITAVGECIGAEPGAPEAFFTAQLLWQQLHGIVSLRISRPRFPWPPLEPTVIAAVDRLLAGASPAGPRNP